MSLQLLLARSILFLAITIFPKWTVSYKVMSFLEKCTLSFERDDAQGWISDMGIDGPTFVPKIGYFLLIWVKVCPQKLAFS